MPTPKPKPRKPAVKKFQTHYSGDASDAFWKAVNRLDGTIPPGPLWRAAVELQSLESKVLELLAAARKGGA